MGGPSARRHPALPPRLAARRGPEERDRLVALADGRVRRAADALGVPVELHDGYRVRTTDLPDDYRGPAPRDLAHALGPELTPDVVAAARRAGVHDPQTVKQVWHLLARFGRAWS